MDTFACRAGRWLAVPCIAALILLGAGSRVDAATDWSVYASPDVGSDATNILNSVSCASVLECWAVGTASPSGTGETLVEEYVGSTWNIVSSPNAGTNESNTLNGVSCPTAASCFAVGSYDDSGTTQTLIEEDSSGTWSVVSSPDTSATEPNQLTSVSCTSATSCIAVGYAPASGGGSEQTLAESWDGTSWSIQSTYDSSATETNELNGVTCLTSTDCVAVGYYYSGSADQALVENFDGTWSAAAAADTSSSDTNILSGISCPSAGLCFADGTSCPTGTSCDPTDDNGLIDEFSASAWSVDATLGADDQLFTIACASANSCFAAGYQYTEATALMFAYDGTSWSGAGDPHDNSLDQFWGMTCPGATDCWAVGNNNGVYGPNQTYIEQYGATPWTLTSSLDVSPGTLSFVSAPPNVDFTSATLDGGNLTTTATQTLDIGDATGSGNGWNVSLSNTAFTNGAQTLANGDFTVGSPSVACDASVTCTTGTWSPDVGYPYTLPGTTATKLVSAEAGTGLGDQTVTFDWSSNLPADIYAGTYTSTWTVTLSSGP